MNLYFSTNSGAVSVITPVPLQAPKSSYPPVCPGRLASPHGSS